MVVAVAAGADDETIVPLKTCEFMIKVPCWGRNSICIPICIAKGYTGGFCDVATCMCTKQCPDEAEAEAGGPSSHPPVDVQPPLGKRGGMLNRWSTPLVWPGGWAVHAK